MKRAVFFGQNAVDQGAVDYAGWPGLLSGCVPDAEDLAIAFRQLGFECQARFSGWNISGPENPWVMTGQCTAQAWIDAHHSLQAIVKAGDLVVLGNSGHGYQYDTPMVFNGGQGQCWFDRLMRDTEFHELMMGWPAGVRVVYILDECFAGGMDREFMPLRPRSMPAARKPAGLIAQSPMRSQDISASVVQFCAATANETAADGPHNGAFTGSLLAVLQWAWLRGDHLTWQRWFDLTEELMAPQFAQHPVINVLGAGQEILSEIIS